jgi:tetratricopeptide (TPR) repeat protein
MCLGRLKEAVTFFERHKNIAYEKKDLEQISISCINLSELYAHTGQLDFCLDAAQKAVEAAGKLGTQQLRRTALARQGWALHLRYGKGGEEFEKAEKLERLINPDYRFLYSLRGIQHADHLRRTDRLEEAQNITESNLNICEENGWTDHISQCHRVLGNIFEARNQNEQASKHFNESLKNAQLNSRKDVLIRILLARGRWYARLEKCNEAFSDLNEAFKFAEAGRYIIYEISIRIALSLAHIAREEFDLAESQLHASLYLSNQVDYFWGKRDSQEALDLLKTARA